MKLKKALLVVNLQNDFCPCGVLAVAQGNAIIPVANKCIRYFSQKKSPEGSYSAFQAADQKHASLMMAAAALAFPESTILKKIVRASSLVFFASIVASGIVILGYLFKWLLG